MLLTYNIVIKKWQELLRPRPKGLGVVRHLGDRSLKKNIYFCESSHSKTQMPLNVFDWNRSCDTVTCARVWTSVTSVLTSVLMISCLTLRVWTGGEGGFTGELALTLLAVSSSSSSLSNQKLTFIILFLYSVEWAEKIMSTKTVPFSVVIAL